MKKTHDKRFLKPLVAVAALLTVCSVAPAQTKSAPTSDDSAPRYEIGVFGGVQYWGVNTGGKFVTNKVVQGGISGFRFCPSRFRQERIFAFRFNPRGLAIGRCRNSRRR